MNSAGDVLVRTLIAAVPSVMRLNIGLEPSPSFFGLLPQLAALRELGILSDGSIENTVHLLASLERLTAIRLPCTMLFQGEVQALVYMLFLRELSARSMYLEDEVDSSASAWRFWSFIFCRLALKGSSFTLWHLG